MDEIRTRAQAVKAIAKLNYEDRPAGNHNKKGDDRGEIGVMDQVMNIIKQRR